MEEKKKGQAAEKVVSLNENSGEDYQKLTYEQLNNACSQLYIENQKLSKQVQQLNYTNMFKRLDYLFLVLKYSEKINDPGFIMDCVDEIKEAIIIPSKEESEEEG